jgi:methylenetetrahydrofolate reductase (NADPH)
MRLRDKFGKVFIITAELDPPRSADPTETLTEALAVRGYVDAVNISDSPQANLRMTPLVAAHLVQEKTGLEVIAHFTCRDRNILGLQSELLGAAALGVQNILALRGDPPERGDHPTAQGVFELDAVGLTRAVSGLNANRSLAGRDLERGTDFAIAVAANPGAKDLQIEKDRFLEKTAAGAHFAQTQPVFDAQTVEDFVNAFGGQPPIPVLYGVLPVRSLEMAERVGKWTSVPDSLVDDLRARGRIAGIEWAQRVIGDLRAMGVPGVHLYPLGRPKVVAQVLGALTDPISRLT